MLDLEEIKRVYKSREQAKNRYKTDAKYFNVGCMLDYMNYTPRTLEHILENGE